MELFGIGKVHFYRYDAPMELPLLHVSRGLRAKGRCY